MFLMVTIRRWQLFACSKSSVLPRIFHYSTSLTVCFQQLLVAIISDDILFDPCNHQTKMSSLLYCWCLILYWRSWSHCWLVKFENLWNLTTSKPNISFLSLKNDWSLSFYVLSNLPALNIRRNSFNIKLFWVVFILDIKKNLL